VFPKYEIKETSYPGVVMLAAIIKLYEVLGLLIDRKINGNNLHQIIFQKVVFSYRNGK
jgi:hypothetical protein